MSPAAAVDTPVDGAADDHARADTGGDLDQGERRAVRVPGALFAVRHQVGVVVDEDGDTGAAAARLLREGAPQAPPDVVTVPARHDRRLHDPPGLAVDRARHRQPDPAHRAHGPPGLLQQFGEPAAQFAEDRVRAVLDTQRAVVLGLDLAGQRDHGGPAVPGVEIGGEDDGVRVVELQGDGGAAAQR